MTTLSDLKDQYPWLFSTSPLSIDIIYDLYEPEEDDDPREIAAIQDTINTAKKLLQALEQTGNKVTLSAVGHSNFEHIIPTLSGDIVFNQVEEDELGLKVLKLLEHLNKPVTGVDSQGWLLSWNKENIKYSLIKADVPTPKHFVTNIDQVSKLTDLQYPLFVKAANDHGSLSINQNSVTNDFEQLTKQVAWIEKTIGGDSLVEEYIDGRELYVTILGNDQEAVVLPPEEIVFGKEFDDRPKIVTYQAKWEQGSLDYQGTDNVVCPIELTDKEMEEIEKAVRLASTALKVRDYARFDIRLKNNTPYIIDYNANPGISPEDPSTLPAKVFGLDYPQFISSIANISLNRFKKNSHR